jgi:hypothetical protein
MNLVSQGERLGMVPAALSLLEPNMYPAFDVDKSEEWIEWLSNKILELRKNRWRAGVDASIRVRTRIAAERRAASMPRPKGWLGLWPPLDVQMGSDLTGVLHLSSVLSGWVPQPNPIPVLSSTGTCWISQPR